MRDISTEYTDIEVRLGSRRGESYPVTLAIDQDRVVTGSLAKSITNWRRTADSVEDGQRLFNRLFADSDLKRAWDLARGRSRGHCRLRLAIDERAPELHALPWELLQDDGRPLAAQSDTPFSRYLAGEWEPGQPIRERPLKLLVAIADPANLVELGFATINRFSEKKIIKHAVETIGQDQLKVEFLDAPVSLNRLEQALRNGYHMLHVVGHGRLEDRTSELILANEENWIQPATGESFAQMIVRLPSAPQLIVLASCQTAARSPADAWRGLAPRLINAGVPAVLAMQDRVTVSTARQFSNVFYRKLLELGVVDLACNLARASLVTTTASDADIPVLYSRLPDNRLFAVPERMRPKRTTPEQKASFYLLERVRRRLLEREQAHGLSQKMWIEQERCQHPGAVGSTLSEQIAAPDVSPEGEPIPPTMPIMEVFQRIGQGALLILGPPKSGKTTQLVELAKSAADRAEMDLTQPVPLLVDLSRWSPTVNLDDWLVTHMVQEYGLDEGAGRTLLANDRLLLLLDNLDRLDADARAACVEVINDFRARDGYGSVQLAVCCEAEQYESIGRRLRLANAIFLEPNVQHRPGGREPILSFDRDIVALEIQLRHDGLEQYSTELIVQLVGGGQREFTGQPIRLADLPTHDDRRGSAEGTALFDWLLDSSLKKVWDQIHRQDNYHTIRLNIPAEALELQALPWELLHDGRQRLSMEPSTPFYRFQLAGDREVAPSASRPHKLLLAVSAPRGVENYKLTAPDPVEERQLLTEILFGMENQVRVTAVGVTEPLKLSALESALQAGCHILHLTGVGVYSSSRKEAALLLADDSGQAKPVRASDFANMIARLPDLPQLVVLNEGYATKYSSAGAWRLFAQALQEVGVPVVLATSTTLNRNEAYHFYRTFYQSSIKANRPLDWAANAARAKLFSLAQGHAPPALFSRTRNLQRFTLPKTSEADSRERRDQLILLRKVREFWVQGVLEQSLAEVAKLELRMESQMDVVDRRQVTLLTEVDSSPEMSGYLSTLDAFDQLGGSLLILGAPGTGKTFALLELARDLLDQAERDPGQPIPVVFNLSSWQGPKWDLVTWMAEELSGKYQIPRKVGRRWIDDGQILPLLDGLDEVKADLCASCVRMINDFRREEAYRLLGLVVCCRTEEYEHLQREEDVRLALEGAILLQSLSRAQIDSYLGAAGPKLAAVRETLEQDRVLEELAETPLMLNVMSVAYQGKKVEELQGYETVEARRQNLFDEYVRQMFRRIGRTKHKPYSDEETLGWLHWLAQKMEKHDQSLFLIENLQPSWLPRIPWQVLYILITRIFVGLLLGLIVLLGSYFYELGVSVITGLRYGATVGLSVAIIDGLRFRRSGYAPPPDKQAQSRRRPLINILGIFLLSISLFFLTNVVTDYISEQVPSLSEQANDSGVEEDSGQDIYGLIADAATQYFDWVSGWISLLAAVSFMFFAAVFFGRRSGNRAVWQDVRTVESLGWSWKGALAYLSLGGISGVIWGIILIVLFAPMLLCFGLLLFIPSLLGPTTPSLPALGAGLLLIISMPIFPLAVVAAMFGGLTGKIVKAKSVPNQGIRLSVRSGLKAGLAFGVIAPLLVLLAYGVVMVVVSDLDVMEPETAVLEDPESGIASVVEPESVSSPGPALDITFSELIDGMLAFLPGSFLIGFLAFLWFGGLDVFQHFVLRAISYKRGKVPRDYAHFLDYAAERVFLRKVGGGYIFIHRLLQEHFARLEMSPNPREEL